MLPFLTVTVSVPNALPETVTLWFCSKMASHSARADQWSANAHSTPRPSVAPKLLLLPVPVKEAGTSLTVSPGLLVPTQAPPRKGADQNGGIKIQVVCIIYQCARPKSDQFRASSIGN